MWGPIRSPGVSSSSGLQDPTNVISPLHSLSLSASFCSHPCYCPSHLEELKMSLMGLPRVPPASPSPPPYSLDGSLTGHTGLWPSEHGPQRPISVSVCLLCIYFSHPSTSQAQPCLASEIRQDQAHSGWYGYRRYISYLQTRPNSKL